jgi:hypothetical protein
MRSSCSRSGIRWRAPGPGTDHRDELVRARTDYLSAKATVSGKQQADAALLKFY